MMISAEGWERSSRVAVWNGRSETQFNKSRSLTDRNSKAAAELHARNNSSGRPGAHGHRLYPKPLGEVVDRH